MKTSMSEKIETSLTIDDNNKELKASLVLANHTGLSQASIKDAMHKGAVWLSRSTTKKRLRRATGATASSRCSTL